MAAVELVAAGVSKGFFNPIQNLRVRLVTDYTKLKEFVKRPVHPFPSVKEIVQSIPAGTRHFTKMDAVHGYFQLALDDRSSKITTFLLPSGRFHYLRAPMGLSSSSLSGVVTRTGHLKASRLQRRL